jgi:hypothetical protein
VPEQGRSQLTPEEVALDVRYREIADRVAELGTERGMLIDKTQRSAEEEQRLAVLDSELVVAGDAFQSFLSRLESQLGATPDASAKAFAVRESQGLMEHLRELGTVRSRCTRSSPKIESESF